MTNKAIDPRDVRFSDPLSGRRLRGRRILARCTPQEAVSLATQNLLAQGFTWHESNLDELLKAQSSPWTGTALRIGDAAKSWRNGILPSLIDFEPLTDLIPGLRRSIAPTLVVTTAKTLPDGTSELIVMPRSSWKGDPDSTYGARSIIDTAIEQTIQTLHGRGALVSVDKPLIGVQDAQCPASRQSVKRLLAWR